MPANRAEIGLANRRAVLGDAYVDAALADVDNFNREFQALVNEYCWGVAWSGPALTFKQRSLNNLCLMAALNRPAEFRVHVRGALRNGCSPAEIKETLIQITVYAGIPAGVEAFRLAREVLAESAAGDAST